MINDKAKTMIRSCLVAALAAGLFPAAALAQSVAGISVPGVINLGGGLVGGVGGAAGGAIGGVSGGLGGAVGGLGGAVGGIGGAVGGAVGGLGGSGGGLGGGGDGGGGLGGGGLGDSLGDGLGSGLGAPGGGVATIALAAAGVTSFTPVDLPSSLLPGRRRDCTRALRNERECRELQNPDANLHPRPGTPTAVVQACRNTVVASSLRYGVARVDAASAGPMVVSRGGADAPIEFRMIYERQSGPEVRHATIHCRLDNAGRVIAAI